MYLHWQAVTRNIYRARRRMLRPELMQGGMDIGPSPVDDGAILHVLSEDEDTPAALFGALTLHPTPGSCKYPSDSEDGQPRLHSHSGERFAILALQDIPN